VLINLGGLADTAAAQAARREASEMLDRGRALADRARAAVRASLDAPAPS
jgi:hypothetical protein